MTDLDISRTLSALGHAEAPTGLDARLLVALEQQARTQQTRRSFSVAWIAAPAAVVLAALLLATHKSVPSSSRSHRDEWVAATEAAPQLSAVAHKASSRSAIAPRRSPSLFSLRSVAEESVVAFHPTAATEPEPGYPAPAAPLTDQEKLLLRLAHRPNEGIVAMFDPAIREERAAADKAAFEFFNPPRPFLAIDNSTDQIITDQTQEPHDDVSPGKQ